ncbi:EpsG family protein [Deinococcus sp. UR1]|uniref:EpsG family protein n=1 Tax=Deinococcus sp. UR1 TaxID=1704277 RepID=UPI000A97F582|nr:EpsG family protein [Deinococcus sp. UR1]PIG99082.1 hypothetical protein AMD26_004815 [Deinococcus sp. UR1]
MNRRTTLNVKISTSAPSHILIFLPLLTYSLYWGMRKSMVGSDTLTYEAIYRSYLRKDVQIIETSDAGFLWIMHLASIFSSEPKSLFILICLIISVSFYISGVIFLKKPIYLAVYVFILITSPIYMSINTNILRHGIAIAIAILGMSIVYRFGKNILKIPFAYLPTLFHSVAGILSLPLFIKIIRYNTIHIWVLLVIISYFSGYYSTSLSNFIPDDYFDYLSGNFEYRKGFRIEFVAFSAIPIFMTIILPFRRMSPETKWVFNAYLLMNGAALVMNFISYSDRLLTNSWITLPLLTTLIIKDINTVGYRRKDNRLIFTGVVLISIIIANIGIA